MSTRPKQSFFRELAEIPVYTAAQFVKTDVSGKEDANASTTTICAKVSVADHLRNVKRSLAKTIVYKDGRDPTSSPSYDLADVVASTYSPSGRLHAVLRDTAGENGTRKRFVEIWNGDALVAISDVSSVHQEFYIDDLFSSLAFSHSETSFIYTAEAKDPADQGSYDKYRFAPHQGEKLVGRKRPTLFLIDYSSRLEGSELENPQCEVVQLALSSHNGEGIGQAVFATETQLYATAYHRTGDDRFLGPFGCFNRPSSIWQISLPEPQQRELPADQSLVTTCSFTQITTADRSSRSPRIVRTKEASYLVWLSNEAGGPHHSCTRLHIRDLQSGQHKVLVDTVQDGGEDGERFPGLYVDHLPAKPGLFLNGEPYIVTQSVWGCYSVILLISLRSGQVKRLTKSEDSYTVFDTDWVSKFVCGKTSLTQPSGLVLAQIDEKNLTATFGPTCAPKLSAKTTNLLESLKFEVVSIPGRYPLQSIIVTHRAPHESKTHPCITIPHGGPHVASTVVFNANVVALALEGYTISIPNYTGSLGYGEKHVKALVGQCGGIDVEDCVESVKHLIKLGIAGEGKENHFFLGGSHSGFLGAHLIGRYADLFAAAVLRNPVISVPELTSVSDIPDWSFEEFGITYGPQTLLTPELFLKLYQASPMQYVDKVETPLLLVLGEQDQRVPPYQGRNYYHALKGRGKTVDMICFPGKGHGLDHVESARMTWEATRDWFAKFRT